MYRFYIDGVQLPIAPSEHATQINSNNEQMQLLSGDEINILKKPKLTDFSFTCDLPLIETKGSYIYYPQGKFQSAQKYLDMFENLKKQKKVFDFIIVRDYGNQELFDTKMKVSLEDYKIDENAEYGAVVKVELRLKQYKEYSTKKLDIKIDKYRPTVINTSSRGASTKTSRGGSSDKSAFRPGAIVIVNGQLHLDSWGRQPGQWRRNWKGKISHTNWSGGATFNIHVTTMDGLWQGWVRPSEVRVIG